MQIFQNSDQVKYTMTSTYFIEKVSLYIYILKENDYTWVFSSNVKHLLLTFYTNNASTLFLSCSG